MNTQVYLKRIDDLTGKFKNTFGQLNTDQLNHKPDEQTWSIAQNIDHIIVTNESYFPVIESLRNGSYKKPFVGKFDFVVNFFGNMILKAVQPDRKRKMKTFSVWQPGTSVIPPDILSRFEQHQKKLKQTIESTKDLIENKVVISSPANKNIVYTLGTAFEIIVTHEERHLLQAKEVLKNYNII